MLKVNDVARIVKRSGEINPYIDQTGHVAVIKEIEGEQAYIHIISMGNPGQWGSYELDGLAKLDNEEAEKILSEHKEKAGCLCNDPRVKHE